MVSDFPIGWKLIVGFLEGCAIFAGWKMGAPDRVLDLMAGLFGLSGIAKMVTDTIKIKAAANGNGKPKNGDFDTTGKPKNGGDVG